MRRAAVGRRRRVLDLACGHGVVVPELARRAASSSVIAAVDRSEVGFRASADWFAGAVCVRADAHALPFASDVLDLVFCQCALFWMRDPHVVLAEIARVLTAEGVLVAIEPDYGAMIEHPPERATGSIWVRALERAGADPFFGRKLPGLLAGAGLTADVQLLDRLMPPEAARFDVLAGLPLNASEAERVEGLREREGTDRPGPGSVAHLPFFLVVATRALD